IPLRAMEDSLSWPSSGRVARVPRLFGPVAAADQLDRAAASREQGDAARWRAAVAGDRRSAGKPAPPRRTPSRRPAVVAGTARCLAGTPDRSGAGAAGLPGLGR